MKSIIKITIFSIAMFINYNVHSQDPDTSIEDTSKWAPEMTEFWEPEVEVIKPGNMNPDMVVTPPSDALVLFNGTDLSEWEGKDGKSPEWIVEKGQLKVNKGTGMIQTKSKFEDFQLHIEWSIPKNISGKGQARGNSGIFLQGIYEVQVLDNFENRTYANGQTGSIYKQTPPLKNVMRPPGEWNVYDIIYTAPRFKEDGSLFAPARVTIIQNSVVVQNNTVIKGNTPYTGLPQYSSHGKGPIALQDHGDPSEPIAYRNIWIRNL